MSIFNRGNNKEKDKEKSVSPHNSKIENDLVCKIDYSQQYAEGGKRTDIEVCWDDEYKIYIGKQWDTSKGLRSKNGKKRNFNSQDNLVFPMIQNMLASLTATVPDCEYEGIESGDDDIAEVLNDLVPTILARNKFPEQWKKIVLQGLQYGPFIGYITWDQHMIGGSGPNRWVGEVKTQFLKKHEFFPDPAILDLEERLQECSYINLKQRKKLSWFSEMWPEKGKHVVEDTEDIEKDMEDEGQDPQQATLITHFHKGVPEFVPEEWKKIFLEKAEQAEAEGLPYKAQDYRDMAEGILKGVHCAYKAGTILLDYVPYIYDDGLYPIVYRVLYADEKQPWGLGEIRNVVIPQILHNKADEIELGAMLGQGLGGGFYNKGAISTPQKSELIDNIAKANAWLEVNEVNGIKFKQQVQVPNTITNYKKGKREMIDTISQNTAIQQGISPGANVPYSTIAELGARADMRTKSKVEVLEDFLKDFFKLIVNRIAQFYTEERAYRILGDRQIKRIQTESYRILQQIANMPVGTPPEQQIGAMIELLKFIKTQSQKPKIGRFNRRMLVRTWDRDTDENGEPMKEEFIPEFDIKVKVMDERPTNRNYYSSMASQLLGKAMGIKAFWRTLDEGKFPPISEILEELDQMQQAQLQAQNQATQQAMLAKQQEKEQDRQASLDKIALQNQSMEKQVAISALAKVGNKR
jgi:hypothetical protein